MRFVKYVSLGFLCGLLLSACTPGTYYPFGGGPGSPGNPAKPGATPYHDPAAPVVYHYRTMS